MGLTAVRITHNTQRKREQNTYHFSVLYVVYRAACIGIFVMHPSGQISHSTTFKPKLKPPNEWAAEEKEATESANTREKWKCISDFGLTSNLFQKKEEENIGFGWFIYVCNFQCKHKQQWRYVYFVHRASYCACR